jgi:hypothetical protein
MRLPSIAFVLAFTFGCTGGGQVGVDAPGGGSSGSAGPASWGFFLYTRDLVDGLSHARWGRETEVLWSKVETPPGSGSYNWNALDTAITTAQMYGISGVLVLKTGNGQAFSEPACFQAIEAAVAAGTIPPEERRHYSCPITAASESAWRRMVGELIERYDGDGDRDMPGLTGNVRVDIEVENEAADPQYWDYGVADGTAAADSYLRLLELSYQAKQAADSRTQVILSGLVHPHRLARCDVAGASCSAFYVRNLAFTKRILSRPDLFDAIDVHFFDYYHFDPRYIDDGYHWVADQMAQHGYRRPIFSLEWTGTIMLAIQLDGHQNEFLHYFPYAADFATVDAFSAMYMGLDQPQNVKYRRWFEAEQAKEFGKLFTNMLGLGVERLIYVRYSDYDGNWNNVWWNWQGVIKYVAGAPIRKPSYYTYNLFADRLDGFASARSIEQTNGARLYEFTFAAKPPVYVLWSDVGDVSVDLSSLAAQLRVTHIVTALDAADQPVTEPEEIVPAGSVIARDVPVFLDAVE